MRYGYGAVAIDWDVAIQGDGGAIGGGQYEIVPGETRVVIFDAGRQSAATSRRREPVRRDVETIGSVIGVFALHVGVFADFRYGAVSLPLNREIEVNPLVFSRLPDSIGSQPAPLSKNIWRLFADRSGTV